MEHFYGIIILIVLLTIYVLLNRNEILLRHRDEKGRYTKKTTKYYSFYFFKAKSVYIDLIFLLILIIVLSLGLGIVEY